MTYFDYAATTPMSEKAIQAYQLCATNFFGNPSSLHDVGSSANNVLEQCRQKLAQALHVEAESIYFTSGGSEATKLVILSAIKARMHRGKHLITSELEHSSVLNIFSLLEGEGFEVTYLKPDYNGEIDLLSLKAAIRHDTILASIQHVNSEIGVIQNIAELGKILDSHDIFFHSDCVQSFGKIPLHVDELHVDAISISSHKIYGPKGCGACYLSPKQTWKPIIPHTTHEHGLRPGTVDVPSIAAFATAVEERIEVMHDEFNKVEQLREHFLTQLKKNVPQTVCEGNSLSQLPHIIGLRIPSIEGQYMMAECNRKGIAIATGSACHIDMQSPSSTMTAIGHSKDEAKEFFRVTLGKHTIEASINHLVDIIKQVAKQFY
ncbi:IscS subfamily cysteine desulfurase [Bacillus solimangrovi]|uniref:Cysteine desulfurase n=1 Tax=Bacillus solimangrovi TaxID=1305675 RepID=A0A1E5LJY0_9BACI|nr:IscS subfamily cysteine desulfurase [Bacillus solimangrovi]OEH94371.1 cysteine desulfurase [Bacillus solimangrovi]